MSLIMRLIIELIRLNFIGIPRLPVSLLSPVSQLIDIFSLHDLRKCAFHARREIEGKWSRRCKRFAGDKEG